MKEEGEREGPRGENSNCVKSVNESDNSGEREKKNRKKQELCGYQQGMTYYAAGFIFRLLFCLTVAHTHTHTHTHTPSVLFFLLFFLVLVLHMSEEAAFWLFVRLLYTYGLGGLFVERTPTLQYW